MEKGQDFLPWVAMDQLPLDRLCKRTNSFCRYKWLILRQQKHMILTFRLSYTDEKVIINIIFRFYQ